MDKSLETTNLPGGPSGRWGATLKLIRNPRRAFTEWIQNYGDPFLIHALNGPVIVTGRSDLVRQIFGHDPDDFGLFAMATVRPILGAGSVLLMDGKPHRRERKLLTPMFHGDRMKAYGQAMQEVVMEHAGRLQPGRPLLGLQFTTRISLEIIARAIFGARDRPTIDGMIAAARNLARKSTALIFFSKKMQFRCLGLSPWDRFLRPTTLERGV